MTKKVKIFLTEEGEGVVQQYEVGFGSVEQFQDGSLSLDLMLIGDYTLRSNNVAGMAHVDGYIPAALRKD